MDKIFDDIKSIFDNDKSEIKIKKSKYAIINRYIERLLEIESEIKSTGIKTKKLLNREEKRLSSILNDIIDSKNYYYSEQVPLASFLDSKQWNTYYALYVDFLILDYNNNPKLVIEYHGSGHYGDNELTKMRVKSNDKIKEIIFKSANIPLAIITNDDFEKGQDWADNVAKKIGDIAKPNIDNKENDNGKQILNWVLNKIIDKQNCCLNEQISIAQFLKSNYWYQNNLYIDFAIYINNELLLVIEYLSSGHYGDNDITEKHAKYNDEIKEIIFKKTNIPLVIITNKDIEKGKAWYCNVAEKICKEIATKYGDNLAQNIFNKSVIIKQLNEFEKSEEYSNLARIFKDLSN